MGSKTNVDRLFLCYISGLDLRRIVQNNTPFIYESLKSYPWVRVINIPSTDEFPTLLTGAYPSEHGMWGVRIKHDPYQSLISKFIDKLPDIITTTTQCLLHLFTSSFDLPSIPPSRRRFFEILKTQHDKHYKKADNLLKIGGLQSCFGVVGRNQSNYIYSRSTDPIKKLITKLASGNYNLEILQLYSADLMQRWNMHNTERILNYYGIVDRFIEILYEKCKAKSIIFTLYSDHGYDEITSFINISDLLQKLDLSQEEYKYFIEVSIARFWFYTERARIKISEMLRGLENTSYFSFLDLHKYNLSFPDSQYGEAFSMTHPGYIFFPNDFYHPLANLYLGLTDTKQRSRLFNPRHSGDHVLLPQFDSAKGFMILLDKSYRTTRQEINPIDIAPSLLDLLGYDKPGSMKGRSVFQT
jgi:hypothetical protein